MSNPRPCVCGHPEADHEVESARPSCGRCWAMLQHCHGYRKKLRTEPLRARRGRTKVTLRPSTEPAQSWTQQEVMEQEPIEGRVGAMIEGDGLMRETVRVRLTRGDAVRIACRDVLIVPIKRGHAT